MADTPPGATGEQEEQPDKRTGEDTRRRGWFWHWNSIVTQYAPLIGLKGVGLLNSYTVWTDRREDSPHRGYAFPSQQAESAFYGEDRAELITINKILVTLDLIEVRKEMVLHVDDKGRRWKVPHNLYRVKDNPNGFNLTVEDVLRVAELAAKTPAVYRYIRRVFSANFAPIDPKNPWHEILPAVRQTETWQKLAARAAREDARASARSKAGHRKRKGEKEETRHGDSDRAEVNDAEVTQPLDEQTSVAPDNTGSGIDVEATNNGLEVDVGGSNRAFDQKSPTIAGPLNEGDATVVDSTNTTYNQETLNTTRTTTAQRLERDQAPEPGQPPAGASGSGPVLQASPPVLLAFESANDRAATTLERELLGELERDFAEAADRAGQPVGEWVVDAIREAVNSGSRFVAPKRIREILSRWSTARGRELRSGGKKAPLAPVHSRVRRTGGDEIGAAWRSIIAELQTSHDWGDLGDALAGSVLLGEENGRIRIGLAQPNVSEETRSYIRQAVEPRFIEYLSRSVALDIELPGSERDDNDAPRGEGDGEETAAPERGQSQTQPAPRFSVVEGLTNSQAWAAAQEDLRARISSANFETWIRPASLIGRDDAGCLILGVPNRFAQQRVDSKLRGDIEAALSNIIGQPVEVRVVVAQQWLKGQA